MKIKILASELMAKPGIVGRPHRATFDYVADPTKDHTPAPTLGWAPSGAYNGRFITKDIRFFGDVFLDETRGPVLMPFDYADIDKVMTNVEIELPDSFEGA
jgi:hypothetical protein